MYLQGEQSGDSDEVGPLVLGYADYSTPDALVTLFGSTLPTTVGAILRLRISFYQSLDDALKGSTISSA